MSCDPYHSTRLQLPLGCAEQCSCPDLHRRGVLRGEPAQSPAVAIGGPALDCLHRGDLGCYLRADSSSASFSAWHHICQHARDRGSMDHSSRFLIRNCWPDPDAVSPHQRSTLPAPVFRFLDCFYLIRGLRKSVHRRSPASPRLPHRHLRHPARYSRHPGCFRTQPRLVLAQILRQSRLSSTSGLFPLPEDSSRF